MAKYNSKLFIDYILKYYGKLEKICNDDKFNTDLLQTRFKEMSESELQLVMNAIDNRQPLPGYGAAEFIIPFYVDDKFREAPDMNSLLGLGDEVGAELFSYLWSPDHVTGEISRSPARRGLVLLDVRRQIQNISDKLAVSKDSNVRDELTGQVTGSSKSSSFSLPEAGCLAARGEDMCSLEYYAGRGGDSSATNTLNRAIAAQGGVDIQTVLEGGSGVPATRTINTYLTGMMFATNLME